MKFVAAPIHLIALAILFGANVTLRRQIGEHFRQCHAPLAFQARVPVGYVGSLATRVTTMWTRLGARFSRRPAGDESGPLCRFARCFSLLFELGFTRRTTRLLRGRFR